MPRKASTQTAQTPAKRQRETIANAIRERGGSQYNIWLVRPPFDSEDIVLSSDIALELFYYVEGEPSFGEISYAPLRARSEEKRTSIVGRPFANVTTTDNRKLVVVYGGHATRSKSKEEPDAGRIDICLEDLDAKAQRVENWRRVVAHIRRVRPHPIATLRRRIEHRLRDEGKGPISWLCEQFSDEHPGLLMGAIATSLRRRVFCSDLDAKPWSLHTLIWSAGQ